jgi:putative ABC transport system substrate-binding protein
VFVQVSDPVAQGFVASMRQPGGNLTGFSIYEFSIDGMLERIGSAIMRLFGGVAPARDARPDKPAPPG